MKPTARFRWSYDPDTGEEREEAWFECSFGDGWIAAYRLVPQGGRPVFAELRVFPAEPGKRQPGTWSGTDLPTLEASATPGGITADLLRELRVGEHRDQLDSALEQLDQKWGDRLYEPGGLLERHGFGPLERRRPGRGGHGDLYYTQLAAMYASLVEEGVTRPIPAIADRIGRPPEYVRDVIHDCRSRRLLTKAPKGKAGGRLTAKARRILATQEED